MKQTLRIGEGLSFPLDLITDREMILAALTSDAQAEYKAGPR